MREFLRLEPVRRCCQRRRRGGGRPTLEPSVARPGADGRAGRLPLPNRAWSRTEHLCDRPRCRGESATVRAGGRLAHWILALLAHPPSYLPAVRRLPCLPPLHRPTSTTDTKDSAAVLREVIRKANIKKGPEAHLSLSEEKGRSTPRACTRGVGRRKAPSHLCSALRATTSHACRLPAQFHDGHGKLQHSRHIRRQEDGRPSPDPVCRPRRRWPWAQPRRRRRSRGWPSAIPHSASEYAQGQKRGRVRVGGDLTGHDMVVRASTRARRLYD